jgi:hypothetical protein
MKEKLGKVHRMTSISGVLWTALLLGVALLLGPSGAWAQGESCVPDLETLCLGEGGRFRVTADYEVLPEDGGGTGPARVMQFFKADGGPYRDTGLLWFFSPDNLEVAVTVLNGCRVNGAYWVKTSGATNQGYTLQVEDTLTGATAEYGNPLEGELVEAVIDTGAFPQSCGANATYDPSVLPRMSTIWEIARYLPAPERATGRIQASPQASSSCVAGPETLCLGAAGRFKVTAEYEVLPENGGGSGSAGMMEFFKADGEPYQNTGLLWFFRAENLEVAVTVLNGCNLSGAYWVKTSGATNQGYTLRVEDTQTGAVAEYGNPLDGELAEPVIDTQAFPGSCPGSGQEIVGSGNVAEEERSISGVVGVSLLGVGNVDIRQGSAEALTVRADDNLLPYLHTRVVDGILEISIAPSVELQSNNPFEFDVTVNTLESVLFAGVGSIEAAGLTVDDLSLVHVGVGGMDFSDLQANTLEVLLAGVGSIRTSGEVVQQTVTLAGVGGYDGEDLQSAEAEVLVAGLGSATVRVSDRLVATISGFGSVFYIGNPTVEATITGFGDVVQIGD